MRTTPGLAAEAYAAVKAAKYADQDDNVINIPFILETGGRVNKAARDWLDTLTAPEPGEQVPSQDDHQPWNPQTRTTTETVLREARCRRAGPHVCEDCGGDPLCSRPSCRVGTAAMLTTPTSFSVAPERFYVSSCF